VDGLFSKFLKVTCHRNTLPILDEDPSFSKCALRYYDIILTKIDLLYAPGYCCKASHTIDSLIISIMYVEYHLFTMSCLFLRKYCICIVFLCGVRDILDF
jgi:hypothetical protein